MNFIITHIEKDPLLCLMGGLLLLALACLWVNKHLAVVLAMASAGIAYSLGRLNPMALAALFSLVAFLLLDQRLRSPLLKRILSLAIIGLCSASFFHLLPGFINWQVLPPTQVSAGAAPYDFYLNLDKGLMGFILLFFLIRPASTGQDWSRIAKGTFALAPWTIASLLGATYLFGWIHYDPKWLPFMTFWIPVNLLTVCLVEEVFFRGFVQQRLSQWAGSWNGLALTTFLFTASHGFFTHDWRYLSLVALASFFYGLTYQITQRIEASTLVHFTVNLIHISLWTYPQILVR